MIKFLLKYHIFLAVFVTLFSTVKSSHSELISVHSTEGGCRLARSIANSDFLSLANHYESQGNKCFCSLASTSMVLNSLSMDYRSNEHILSEYSKMVPENMRFSRRYQLNVLPDYFIRNVSGNGGPCNGTSLSELSSMLNDFPGVSLEVGRVADKTDDRDIVNSLITAIKNPESRVIVNYDRSIVDGATGGHFSPLGTYDFETDSFLIMDVNNFRHYWAWTSSEDLIAGMRSLDSNGCHRGYMIVRRDKDLIFSEDSGSNGT